MKLSYIKLTDKERTMLLAFLRENLRELHDADLDINRQRKIAYFYTYVRDSVPKHTRLLKKEYYEIFFAAGEVHWLLREIIAVQKKDVRDGFPLTDTNSLLIKFEKMKTKNVLPNVLVLKGLTKS